MEEAEALCSRIAIQVDGLFRCLGSAQQIKSRYGQGLELNARLKAPDLEQVAGYAEMTLEQKAQVEMQAIMEKKAAFEQSLVTVLNQESGGQPSLSLLEGSGTSFRYQIFPAALKGRFAALGELFKFVQDNQATWGLDDFQLSQTTLEQIFNRFAATQGAQQQQQAAPQQPPQAAVAQPEIAQGVPQGQADPPLNTPQAAPASGEACAIVSLGENGYNADEKNPTVVSAAVVGKSA